MQTYAILRRSGWRSPEDLEEAAARSKRVGEQEMPDDVRWIRTYALAEDGGSVGTVCIYQATGPEAIREHAGRAFLPVDEIIPVADTVVVRRMRVVMDDGTEGEAAAGDAFVIAPGHDAWIVGDETCVFLDFSGMADYAR